MPHVMLGVAQVARHEPDPTHTSRLSRRIPHSTGQRADRLQPHLSSFSATRRNLSKMDVPLVLDIDLERDAHQLPVTNVLRDVLKQGDRVADEVLHSAGRKYSEHSPLLSKDSTHAAFSPSLSSRDGESRSAYIKRVVVHEAARITQLFVPIFLATVAETLADTSLSMLIGHTAIGSDTRILAALAITSMYPGMLVLPVILGVTSAVDTLCAQAFGGKRLAEMWLFFQAGLLMSAALLPLLVGITLSAAPVLTALGQDTEIVELAKGVLLATATSLPPMIVSSLVTSTLRAQSITIPGFVASGLAWAVSTPIVLWLAFYTPLGYVGIAMAATVSNTVKTVVVAIAMARSDAFATSWPGWQPQAAWDLVWEMKQLAGSGMLLVAFSSAGMAIFSIIAGMLPEAATAVTASGIFLSALALAVVPFNSMAAAGAIRVGNALGGGQSDRAKRIAQLVLAACFAMGVMELLVVNAVATPFASIFTTDAAAVELGATMIQQLSPLLVTAALACGAQGTLSAMGEQFVCAIACFVFIVVIGVPFGLWCAISLDGGIVGLWYGSIMGFGLFAAAQLVWLHRLDWEAAARSAEQRTHMDQTVSDHLKPVGVADAA